MDTPSGPRSRGLLVGVAAVLMGMGGAYQFVWSSIRLPLGSGIGASEAALGTVFTLFVVFQTLSQFPAGWVRDRWGPRWPLLVGAVLLFAGFAGTGQSSSLLPVLVFYSLGGIGAGIVYTVAVNTPVKWFTERPGLATGAVTMAYSGLSVLLIPGVRRGIAVDLPGTLLALGALAGGVAVVAAAVVRDPPRLRAGTHGERPTSEATAEAGGSDPAYRWHETVRTWQFWLLYAVFVALTGVGLMVIGKAVALATALELSAAAATGSASVIALSDSAGILVGGAVSDRFRREHTAGAALALTGLALAGAVHLGARGHAVGFVGLLGAAAFFRSPAFAIFPVLVGEYYGDRHSSTNYAALFTAKLWGGLLGGTVASTLVVGLGWTETFLVAAAVAIAAGVATLALDPP